MPELSTRYRIDHKVGTTWSTFKMLGNNDMCSADTLYERAREDNPQVEMRLVQITEHEVRRGKGRVYC
jgi:hypothetical protein